MELSVAETRALVTAMRERVQAVQIGGCCQSSTDIKDIEDIEELKLRGI